MLTVQRDQLIEKIISNFEQARRRLSLKDKLSNFMDKSGTHISFPQFFMLQLIQDAPGISIKDIAASLSVTSSAATQLLDPLLEKKLVSKKEAATDRRVLQLQLTDKGESLLVKMRQMHLLKLHGAFKNLTDGELADFSKLINKINFS